MANVNIKFNGKEFLLSCEDGQEEHLEELSLYLNKKFDSLKTTLGNIGENKLLLITSIKIMDEYFETKKNIDQQKLRQAVLDDLLQEKLFAWLEENNTVVEKSLEKKSKPKENSSGSKKIQEKPPKTNSKTDKTSKK